MTVLSAEPTNDFLAVCKPCQRPVRWTDDQRHARFKTATTTCAECGNEVKGERIYGTVTASICDASCMYASGPWCGCSCGGKQHGIKYTPTQEGEALASSVTRYRRQAAKRKAQGEQRRRANAEAKAAKHAAWCEANAELVAWLDDNRTRPFCGDMTRLLGQGKYMTERQEAYARELMEKDRAMRASAADWRAERPELVAWLADNAEGNEFYGKMHDLVADDWILTEKQEAAVRRGMDREVKNATVPALNPGRQMVTGTVVAIEEEWQDHGYYGGAEVEKMVIRTEQGQEVRITVPSSAYEVLELDYDTTTEEALTGKCITVKATVKASRNEPWKGWGSRPSNLAWAK